MNIAGKVLVIDDEEAIRHTLARVLQKSGLEVTTAENGQQGLAFLENTRFDLVFTDLRMPGISGLDTLDIIHNRYPNLPVIVFTALPDLTSAVEALRRGATDYLIKPLKPEVILQLAETILLTQVKERRKREILAQIEALQTELNLLNDENAPLQAPAQPIQGTDRYLTRGSISLDLFTHRVNVGDKSVDLLPTTFEFLLVLARHAPEIVGYQTLVAEAQGYKTEQREAQELVKWHIHHIRQAIETDPRNPKYLFNERGLGYRLVVD